VSDTNNPSWADDDDDKTVVVPTPGGRRPSPSPAGLPQTPRRPRQESIPVGPATGINPLVAAAGPLLTLIATLSKTERLADPAGLRARIEAQMREFSTNTEQSGANAETLKAASYCLCTAIDEAVLRTPWGAASDWRKLSLLRALHGDAWGGEKYFEILQARMLDPGPNIELLELLYICLALGFEGKYAMLDDGAAKRDRKSEELYDVIRRQRGDSERDLSPHWLNEPEAKVRLEHPLPLWVFASAAAAALLTTYIGFRFFLADASAPTLDVLAQVGRTPPSPVIEPPPPPPVPTPVVVTDSVTGRSRTVTPQPPAPPPLVRQPPPPAVDIAGELSGFLKPEIDEGLVAVIDSGTRVTIRITAPPEGRGLFASGSDRVTPQFVPVIERIRQGIAEHQADLPGDIIVVGHTDNIPIRRSLRFNDNYDLSRARAASVAAMLRSMDPPRLTGAVEEAGKGASEPVDGGDPAAGNRTPEQRARNRRVEILIEK
jgi:type VI secretion system protein ImpK